MEDENTLFCQRHEDVPAKYDVTFFHGQQTEIRSEYSAALLCRACYKELLTDTRLRKKVYRVNKLMSSGEFRTVYLKV